MAMTFPRAKLLPGQHRVFLEMGQMLAGTPELFLGAFLLLRKTPPFPRNAETVPGNIHRPKLCGDGIANVARGWLGVECAVGLN